MENEPLSDSELDELIFRGRKLLGIKHIRDKQSVTLGQAIFIFSDRYKQLRKDAPDRFTCSHEEYWEGFYS